MPRYSELLPDKLDALWNAGAPAIVPWGALEWHGPHLPLGLDGIVAEWFAERLSDRMTAVLLPAIWLPMTTLPHRHSLQIGVETFRAILDEVIEGLYSSGARRVCLITGHYAHGHQVEMTEAALRAMDDYPDLCVFSAAPLELLADDSLLDHAAQYETSQLLAIRPNLVRLDLAAPDSLSVHETAVLGERPELGSSEEGSRLLSAGLDAWKAWVEAATRNDLEAHYKRLFDRYAAYMDAYFQGSWDKAMAAWWEQEGMPKK